MESNKQQDTSQSNQTSLPQKRVYFPLEEREYFKALNGVINTSRAGTSFVAPLTMPKEKTNSLSNQES